MPSWKAFNLRLSRRSRHTQKRQKVITGEPTGLRDVKNEGRTDYVYENTETSDKMSHRNAEILCKSTRILRKIAELKGQFALKFVLGANLL
jgi:hypothetical protein